MSQKTKQNQKTKAQISFPTKNKSLISEDKSTYNIINESLRGPPEILILLRLMKISLKSHTSLKIKTIEYENNPVAIFHWISVWLLGKYTSEPFNIKNLHTKKKESTH